MPGTFRAWPVGLEGVCPTVDEEVEVIHHHTGGRIEMKLAHSLLSEIRWAARLLHGGGEMMRVLRHGDLHWPNIEFAHLPWMEICEVRRGDTMTERLMRSAHGSAACYNAHAYCSDFGFPEARMKHWSVTTVLIFVTALIPALPAKAQQNPFTEEQVQGLVRNGAGDESGAKLIEQRGLDFVPTEDFLRSLKAEGANEAFLATVRSIKRPQPTSEEVKKPLNQVQIIALLGGQVPSQRVTMLVQQRGIDFDVTDEYLQEARLAGAEDELISALKTAKVAKPTIVDPDFTGRQVEARQHASRGGQLLYSKRYAEAENEYRAALRLDPQDGNLHSVLGLVLLDENNADGAIVEYHEALRLEPNNDLAHSGLGASLAIKRDWDGAIAEYREALRLNPYDGGTHSLLGTALAIKGDRHGAVTEYREAVRQKPYDDDAHFKLGVGLGSMGDTDGAIAEYREAVRLNPNNGHAHLMLGSALGTKGDWDGEITEEREALRLNPANDAAHFGLGLALSVKGDTAGGMTEVREALRLNPNNYNGHSTLGVMLGNTGDWDGEITEEREALRINPNYADAHVNLGFALGKKGNVDGALAEYREAVRLNPSDALAHFDLGSVLERKHDRQGALQEYGRACELDPQKGNYRNAYDRLLKKTER